MKVKTNHVPEDCDYLTNGKEYKVIRSIVGSVYVIKDDNDKEIHIISDDNIDFYCTHIGPHKWEIIGEEDD